MLTLRRKISTGLVQKLLYNEELEAITPVTGMFLFPVWYDGSYFFPGGIISLN